LFVTSAKLFVAKLVERCKKYTNNLLNFFEEDFKAITILFITFVGRNSIFPNKIGNSMHIFQQHQKQSALFT
jgi:hypothetical protein